MYNQFSPDEAFYQGDILVDTPCFVDREDRNEAEIENASIKRLSVMILSQTCDILRKKFVIIAPVVTVQDLQETGVVNADQIRSLKKQDIKYWFYLPAHEDFPDSYVEFTKITHTSISNLIKNKRMKSLSDLGRHWLSYKVSDFFGRPFNRQI